jgi:prepilin-type N-terminal cleavage/methylation domain-containing protein
VKITDKRAAFTLTELVIATAVLAVLASLSFFTAAPTIRKYLDSRSGFRVARETELAAEWLESVVQRGLISRSDFTISVSRGESDAALRASWANGRETDEWVSDSVMLKFKPGLEDDTNGAAARDEFNFSHRFQTFTPAFTLSVFHKNGKKEWTGWRISVSAFGFVRAFRDA